MQTFQFQKNPLHFLTNMSSTNISSIPSVLHVSESRSISPKFTRRTRCGRCFGCRFKNHRYRCEKCVRCTKKDSKRVVCLVRECLELVKGTSYHIKVKEAHDSMKQHVDDPIKQSKKNNVGSKNKSTSLSSSTSSTSSSSSTWQKNRQKKKGKAPAHGEHQCQHCPDLKPFAGASGLWYHSKFVYRF